MHSQQPQGQQLQGQPSGTHQLNPQQEILTAHPQEFQYVERGMYTKEQTGTVQKDTQPEVRRDIPSKLVQEQGQSSQQGYGQEQQHSGSAAQGLYGKESGMSKQGLSEKEQPYSKDSHQGKLTGQFEKDKEHTKEHKELHGEKRLQSGDSGYSGESGLSR